MEKQSDAPLTMAQVLAVMQKMMEAQNEQFQTALKTVVAEMKKPLPDPIKEAQKLREKETKEKGLKEYWERKAFKKKKCAHLRQNGSCVIAWATQSDGIERGYCPNCDSTFDPSDGELYTQLRRMPRGMAESIRYVY